MKTLLLGLIAAHCVTPFAVASPVAKLGNFELTDQEANNIYVIDRGGRIVKRLTGAVSNEALRALFRAIDAAIADAQQLDPV